MKLWCTVSLHEKKINREKDLVTYFLICGVRVCNFCYNSNVFVFVVTWSVLIRDSRTFLEFLFNFCLKFEKISYYFNLNARKKNSFFSRRPQKLGFRHNSFDNNWKMNETKNGIKLTNGLFSSSQFKRISVIGTTWMSIVNIYNAFGKK